MKFSTHSTLLCTFATTNMILFGRAAVATVINVPADQATIQAAINVAMNGDEIIVAPGTYFENINLLSKAVTLYSSGGAAVTTIDAAGAGSVVTCNSGEGPATIIDGFTITGSSGGFAVGGGMTTSNFSSPTVTNCTFIANSTTSGGGGMFIVGGSSTTVANCAFIGNTAFVGGGMAISFNSNPTVTNCSFSENTATGDGDEMHNNNSNPTVTNCILWGNSPEEIFIVSGAPIVTFCDVQGGFAGLGNINANPLFVNAPGGDLRLDRCSPCIDAGDNDAVPVGVVVDPDGNPRFADDIGVVDTGSPGAPGPPVVDMGAYERQIDSVPTTVFVNTGESIQAAIESACDGDEIVVESGTYNEVIDFLGKAITLRSTDPNDPNDPAVVAATIIDGTGLDTSVVTFISGESASTVLNGFTITGGVGSDLNGDRRGGGMYIAISSPTVMNCVFTGNNPIGATGAEGMTGDSARGGALFVFSGAPTVTNCTFTGNSAKGGTGGTTLFGAGRMGGEGQGGAVYLRSSATFVECTFSANLAQGGRGGSGGTGGPGGNSIGGAFYITAGSATIENCTFDFNQAAAGPGGTIGGLPGIGRGGAIFSDGGAAPTATRCTFTGNTAHSGGGIHNAGSIWTVIDCTFNGNFAFDLPGGAGMSNEFGFADVTNCVFTANESDCCGGAFHNGDVATLTNCTLFGNYAFNAGGGVYNFGGTTSMSNCILWANCPDAIANSSGKVIVTSSDVQGGFTGLGNIDVDPLFVNALGPYGMAGTGDDDLRLAAGSYCIDAGDNGGVPIGVTTDHDLNPRFIEVSSAPDTGLGDCPVVDMGAFEFQDGSPNCCFGDVNGDSMVNVTDLLLLLAAWGPNAGHPADIFDDGNVNVTDLLILLAAWGACP